MFYFVTYTTNDGAEVAKRFYDVESLFKWLQTWKDEVGSIPRNLCVYKGECLFDGS